MAARFLRSFVTVIMSSHLRIRIGSADIVVAFEKMEGLRSLEYLKPTGKMIVNDTEIFPLSVIIATHLSRKYS